ncbi:MAG: isoaspartyl peptidase/L-asparaginase family protein [Candidatus Eremiobacterota bacterium]
MACIIIHGGAGNIDKKREEKGKKIIENILDKIKEKMLRGKAIDIVEFAVNMMEDEEIFNAGYGSVLNYDGVAEMDASIMTDDGNFGSVASIYGVKNPVSVARKVMEETDHLILNGKGAVDFARITGFPEFTDIPEERKKRWKELRDSIYESNNGELRYWKKLKNFSNNYYKDREKYGTVGAVCMDNKGNIASATSTGGIWLKLYGRVGDTPVMGAGNYASMYGGASATGHGEAIIKQFLTKRAVDLMKDRPAFEAVKKAVDEASEKGCSCGLIGIDKKGNIGYSFNTPSMWYGYRKIDLDFQG